LSSTERDLVAAAREARQYAHAPYSRYAVGAALRAVDGTIYRGCNVEISSYGLTECAERVALFSARAAGAREFEAMAVAGPGRVGRPTPPCGACRQVIWDLAGDITVLLANAAGEVQVWRARELLPEPFGPAHLEERQ
jgi:cytidine deaminase